MHAALVASNIYSALAISVPVLHALFTLWVIFGPLLTRGRPCLRWRHIGRLIGEPLAQLPPFPCPLTVLEDWLERSAGVEPERGGFLLPYLDKLVYPNISLTTFIVAAVIVCALNLAFHGWQMWRARLWQRVLTEGSRA